jgi:hypothetical protein
MVAQARIFIGKRVEDINKRGTESGPLNLSSIGRKVDKRMSS